MRQNRRTPTKHRTVYPEYPPYRPTPPAAATLALAAVPFVAMYLLTHPAVAATVVVAAGLMAGTLARRG